jgi:hypothetical protein
MRLFVNFFQPSFKLAAKARDGVKVTKRYHPPATPCQRLFEVAPFQWTVCQLAVYVLVMAACMSAS